MTNGTSQGLYVIITVVIFGIFVSISYLVFQDSLRPKLMSIFETSLTQSENIVKNKYIGGKHTLSFTNVNIKDYNLKI